MSKALVVVDYQYDFIQGTLKVPDGDKIHSHVKGLMERGGYETIVMTQDWHPKDHFSFASHWNEAPFTLKNYNGSGQQVLWPDHCVEGTKGAELQVDSTCADLIIRKGRTLNVDSYSAFRENKDEFGQRAHTGLAGYLKDRGVMTVDVCGLALDYCVKWTAFDAADAGFEVQVLMDATKAVDPSSVKAVEEELDKAGIFCFRFPSAATSTYPAKYP
jgi:nicotinamidase/pyrazinamidase